MRRKSQASLEFLTTYAWAFIIIGITIGALYYFGFFDFSKYLPQKCVFPSQLKCLDFSLDPSNVKLKLVNNLGEDICITSLKITNDAASPITCTAPDLIPSKCNAGELDWTSSTGKDIVFSSCSNGGYLPDSRVDLKMEIKYYAINTPSKPIHTINGKINGRVRS